MITTNQQPNDARSTPAARGKRLKTVRVMAGLTRSGLEKKYGISASTIQSWESAKAGGLTRRGLNRIVPLLKAEGVFCSPDWLFDGIGKPPHPTMHSVPQHSENESSYLDLPEDKIIVQELLTFRKLNPNTIDLIVHDDGMAPHYSPNDYIAGRRRTGNEIDALLDQPCIVETVDNEILLRHLKRASLPSRYTLTCSNLNTSIIRSTLYDQKLLSAARVTWHRRRDEKK